MLQESVFDGMYGLCIGDAVGVPAEFISRSELAEHPIIDMTGYGTHYQRPGTWSDDSSLALCTLDSLAGGIDYLDMMDRFRSWVELGMYTPYGKVFDIGLATDQAIDQYIRDVPVLQCGGTDEYNNGNGSLMRILPLAFYFKAKQISYGQAMEITADVSSLTHAHLRSKMACQIYITIALHLLEGQSLEHGIKEGLAEAKDFCTQRSLVEASHFQRIFRDDFASTPVDEINSTGYVVDTLEAAIWCLLNTKSYKECILKAVNLGDDTDTTASVAGGLAGIVYTRARMPENWIQDLARKDMIDEICARFVKQNFPNG